MSIAMPVDWTPAGEYDDIRYELAEGIAKITIDRPEVRNAFRPETLIEVSDALERAREDAEVGVIVLTGEGPHAFCSGGDQRVRGDTGYVDGRRERSGASTSPTCTSRSGGCRSRWWRWWPATRSAAATSCTSSATSRSPPTTRASARPGRSVGSFDGGFGASLLASLVGPKKAKEIWFLCRQYDAQQALEMGLVNTVVPLERLEEETVQWCREMLALSPFALRLVKASFHAARGRLRRHPAARPRRQPPLLRQPRRRRRGATPTRRSAPPTSRRSRAGRDGPLTAERPSAVRIWLMAARPRTLPAAVAPVLVGTALAATEGTFKVLTFLAALLGALFIQVGTNLSNDYSDARRGADTEDRLGPVRVTAGGLVPPRQVLVATYVAFGLAVLAGSYLIATAGWELLLVGAASILAGVLYTGGPRPYGYEGLGEVFVFLFFGVVAVAGSYYAQVERLEWEALVLAVPVGLLASAILVVNNVRDLETDRRAGKRTLAVRLGRERTRVLYVGDGRRARS